MSKDIFEEMAVEHSETAVSENEIEAIKELLASYSQDHPAVPHQADDVRKTYQGLPALHLDAEVEEESVLLPDILKHEEDNDRQNKPMIDLEAFWNDLDEISDLEAEGLKKEERIRRTETAIFSKVSSPDEAADASLPPVPTSAVKPSVKPPPLPPSAQKQNLSIRPVPLPKQEADENKAEDERARREKENQDAVARAQREIRETVARREVLQKIMAQEAALEDESQFEDDGQNTQIVSVEDYGRKTAGQKKAEPVPSEGHSSVLPLAAIPPSADGVQAACPSQVSAEFGTHLNNLTGRYVGTRPEWVEFETMALPDRDRECHRLYWMIEESLKRKQKKMITITAERGMGKTMFLAQLYGLLSRSRNDIVTITPAYSTSGRPFAAIRHILEQRFYMTAITQDDVHVQLSSPVFSMIPNRDKASRLIQRLETMWEKSRSVRDFEYEAPSCAVTQGVQDRPSAANPVAFDKTSRTVETEIAPYVSAISVLFKADLRHNSMVLLLDDIRRYDIESLALLARVFEALPDCPLTIVMTMDDASQMPQAFACCPCEQYVMSSLSDSDLVGYARRILEKLSQSREKLIIPDDLCQVVAQHACGSPMRARNYMMKLFHPDKMLQWNVNLEMLKKEPVDVGILTQLKARLRLLPPHESAILGIVSILNAPFTVHTLNAIMAGSDAGHPYENGRYLRRLHERGFLCVQKASLLKHTATYIFKHEFERLGISSLIARDVRLKVYASAAQWYALNNVDGRYNETIGDLWRMQAELLLQHEGEAQAPDPEAMLKAQGFYREASHYYERVAYAYMARAQYIMARRMFKKLLKSLPVENISRRIQAALDASHVSLRLGNVDEAFRLAQSAGRHARKLSAFSMVAASSIQIAEILLALENTRHIRKYLVEARRMLNQAMIPSLMLKTYILEIRDHMLHTRLGRAQAVLEHAEKCVDRYDIRTVEALELRRCRADLTAMLGMPLDAVRAYKSIIADAEQVRANTLCADTWRMLGTLQFKMEENDQAFQSWNIALGLVQETNDVCLHANLLCDIADGAMTIRAFKTARSVCEQSLSLARQLRHRSLIARCMLNQSLLFLFQKSYDRCERLLRKAHHIGQSLHMPMLIFSALAVHAQCLSDPHYGYHDLPHADAIFKRIMAFYGRRGLRLEFVRRLPLFADHYLSTQQNIQALNAYKQARHICQSCSMTKTCLFIEAQMRQIFGDDVIGPQPELT